MVYEIEEVVFGAHEDAADLLSSKYLKPGESLSDIAAAVKGDFTSENDAPSSTFDAFGALSAAIASELKAPYDAYFIDSEISAYRPVGDNGHLGTGVGIISAATISNIWTYEKTIGGKTYSIPGSVTVTVKPQ